MTTANLALTQLVSGQSGAEISVNTFLNELDTLVQLSVKDRDLTAPPGGPSEGDRYIPAATATGVWAGHEDEIAAFYAGWIFLVPQEGWRTYVDDEDILLTFDGTNWVQDERLEVEAGLTASTTQTQGAGTSITKKMTEFSTVANPGDAATLDAAVQGRIRIVINDGAETLQLFPASGDAIDQGAANTSISVAPGSVVIFHAKDATTWHTTGNRDMVKIGEVIASNDATVEFADGIDGTFRFYQVLYQCVPASDGVSFSMRTSSDGGSSFDSGASDYKWGTWRWTDTGAQSGSGDTAAPEISLSTAVTVGSDVGEGIVGEVMLYDPSTTDMFHRIEAQIGWEGTAGALVGATITAQRQEVTAIDALQFKFSAGNIESGKFVLYGVR